VIVALPAAAPTPFATSQAHFAAILRLVDSDDALSLSHSELEELLDTEGRKLIRQLLQDHLDLRANREPRVEVVAADGVRHAHVERDHQRPLQTIFGEVDVTRLAYRSRGRPNLHPADAVLNLPVEKHSHGLRKLAAIEASRGSYESAREAIERRTGERLGKLQLEQLVARAAVDFDDYYRITAREPCAADAVLVISCDGKGIVMRPEALREATRRAAAKSEHKLATRLSRGEKANRKRMAEVGCVYDAEPAPRAPEDILRPPQAQGPVLPTPKARAKWMTASVVEDAATVVARLFDEAERRDPEHRRQWVALVDGNNHQLDLIRAEARRRQVEVPILVDVVHVLEYLWKAAWSLYDEGDPAAEEWVRSKALAVLHGRASTVAAAIRRSATRRGLSPSQRQGADSCADYLLNKRGHLDYPRALRQGWPIATGVIEGACRYLVKDRMDITGARWGLDGAEAVLKLRALRTNGDFEEYWRFHLLREKRRIHQSRYQRNSIPSDGRHSG
jgi:hypothetical protein